MVQTLRAPIPLHLIFPSEAGVISSSRHVYPIVQLRWRYRTITSWRRRGSGETGHFSDSQQRALGGVY
jgi:hypothetical protein